MLEANSNKLYILGSGTPTPTPERFGTAYVLKVDDEYIMIDCGPATTYKLVKVGLWPTQVNFLFFSHHHFDHNVDYPCFLLTRWDQSIGAENILEVFGPPPTTDITEKLIGPNGAFSYDWKARVGSPTSQSVYVNRGGVLPRSKPVLKVRNIGPGKIIRRDKWQVTVSGANHVEPWLTSLAYRFDTERGSIIFAGDTAPSTEVSELARGVDVFVAHCWDHQQTMDRNGEAPGQTGTLNAARFAEDAGAKTLLLTHTSANICKPGSREKAIGDIAAVYKGEIIFGEEQMILDLWGKQPLR
ncbi:MAG: MBL fold metallo-hydrolase [Nitrospiraceae bacterium]|nr:MBL fold metallo-hydrolase [Nitrospiraceae bacterium]